MAFRPDAQLPDLNRLKSVLLTSGLQQTNNALWQVINSLIDALGKSNEVLTTEINNSGGTTINETVQLLSLLTGDGDGGGSSDTIPGPKGEPGANGMVPYYIAPSEIFNVPIYKQALFAMNIDNEGFLVIDGFLIEVDGDISSLLDTLGS
jgi:hypothetical protein